MKWLIRQFRKLRNLRRIRRAARNNEIRIDPSDAHRLKFRVCGSGNVIKIPKLSGNGTLRIDIYGDDNHIEFGERVMIDDCLTIGIGQNHPNFGKANSSHVTIGNRCKFLACDLTMYNCHAGVEIGDETGFSFDTHIYNTDAHPVYLVDDLTRPINKVGVTKIGRRVWGCAKCTVLKNTVVADECILGWNSVVSGRFEEPNCAIVGNPARIVKRGITWRLRDENHRYIENV